MSPRWFRGKRASIGSALRHRHERQEQSICCTRDCGWLRTCCTHHFPKRRVHSYERMLLLRSLSREFSAGCLLQVMRLLAYSNAPRFACACAAACSRLPPICCGFLFLPRKKIGRPAARSATTGFSMHYAGRCALRANTAADRGTDPQGSTISSCNKKEPRVFRVSARGSWYVAFG